MFSLLNESSRTNKKGTPKGKPKYDMHKETNKETIYKLIIANFSVTSSMVLPRGFQSNCFKSLRPIIFPCISLKAGNNEKCLSTFKSLYLSTKTKCLVPRPSFFFNEICFLTCRSVQFKTKLLTNWIFEGYKLFSVLPFRASFPVNTITLLRYLLRASSPNQWW